MAAAIGLVGDERRRWVTIVPVANRRPVARGVVPGPDMRGVVCRPEAHAHERRAPLWDRDRVAIAAGGDRLDLPRPDPGAVRPLPTSQPQKDSAAARGKAMAFAPTCSGTTTMARPKRASESLGVWVSTV